MRRAPLTTAIIFVAMAGAAGLVGWSSFAATLAQEDNVRLRLSALRPEDRAIHVRVFTLAGQPDSNGAIVANELARVADFTGGLRRVRVWHPIAPSSPRGTTIVQTRTSNVVLEHGRLPRGCSAGVCEGLALVGAYRPGQLLRLTDTWFVGVRLRRATGLVRIVGTGTIRQEALQDRSELGHHAVFAPELDAPLRALVHNAGATGFWTLPLAVSAIHGFDLRILSKRLRDTAVRVSRDTNPLNPAEAAVPADLLDELADRGDTARSRLLIVAGEAAALIIAFAAFVATMRRRDGLLIDEQLQTLGASRAQVWTARTAQALVPSLLGLLVALGGLLLAVELVGRERALPGGFFSAALPGWTIIAIALVVIAGALTIVLAGAPPRRRFGVGALELAAVASLALLAWQTAATGALDPGRVASSGSNPILILLPALTFFTAAVVLLRAVPLLLRLGERLGRRLPFTGRLAFLNAARNPVQAAGATTFLAVALGAAFFSLSYRATLVRQAHDQADFTAGGAWRVLERGPQRDVTDVTPLTRFRRVSREPPTPVLRLPGELQSVSPGGEPLRVQVVGIPADRLASVRGWRDDFSPLSRAEMARRLHPRPLRLRGPPVGSDVDTVRLWARSDTESPRIAVLHVLLPGQRFGYLQLGLLDTRWRRLQVPLPRSLRPAQLIGLEFLPTRFPLGYRALDVNGKIDVARLVLRSRRRWSNVAGIDRWVAAASPLAPGPGYAQHTSFLSGPFARGLEFELHGTLTPMVRPALRLPRAVPALAGPQVAGAAVDGVVALDIGGRTFSFGVRGKSSLFPTVVDETGQFLVVDYDTLFAALNADVPGTAVPSEAWFFSPHDARFAHALEQPPFRPARVISANALAAGYLSDPLAAGTRDVLLVAAIAGALLALLGLVLATRTSLESERLATAEYEALGVPPTTLSRASQLRLFVLSATGIAAAIVGALAAVRLVGAFVAVTGSGTRPLPPIAPAVAWIGGGVVTAAVAAAGVLAVVVLVRRVFRESTATRLRA
jgi:hypothetical protein